MYQSCRRAKAIKPTRSIHACHLQNWLFPPSVSSRSSTPLLANSKHMPERMPDMDAYDEARNMGVRGEIEVYESGLMIIEATDVEGEGDSDRERGLRSMRGVRSVGSVGSTAWLAVVAVVKIDGAVLGAISGDNGGLTSTGLYRRV